jgi:hypothetical protein
MYLDSQDHVEWDGVGYGTKASKLLEFMKEFPKANFQEVRLEAKRRTMELNKYLNGAAWAINGVRKEWSEQDLGEFREELQVWDQIEKLI